MSRSRKSRPDGPRLLIVYGTGLAATFGGEVAFLLTQAGFRVRTALHGSAAGWVATEPLREMSGANPLTANAIPSWAKKDELFAASVAIGLPDAALAWLQSAPCSTVGYSSDSTPRAAPTSPASAHRADLTPQALCRAHLTPVPLPKGEGANTTPAPPNPLQGAPLPQEWGAHSLPVASADPALDLLRRTGGPLLVLSQSQPPWPASFRWHGFPVRHLLLPASPGTFRPVFQQALAETVRFLYRRPRLAGVGVTWHDVPESVATGNLEPDRLAEHLALAGFPMKSGPGGEPSLDVCFAPATPALTEPPPPGSFRLAILTVAADPPSLPAVERCWAIRPHPAGHLLLADRNGVRLLPMVTAQPPVIRLVDLLVEQFLDDQDL